MMWFSVLTEIAKNHKELDPKGNVRAMDSLHWATDGYERAMIGNIMILWGFDFSWLFMFISVCP